MTGRILVTGSAGLIGSALTPNLVNRSYDVSTLDLRASEGSASVDVRDPDALNAAMADCTGIVHLAAVSRVVWGERDPEKCWSVNVDGTNEVIKAASGQSKKPWVIFASSREVYGEPDALPVSESTPVRPVNVYGRSKVAGEQLMQSAREAGLTTAVLRFSNVYGSTNDHPDRVTPAFARAAAEGGTLRVDGAANTFDFTHLDDTIRGLLSVIDQMGSGSDLPTIHFVTGKATTLGELANLAVSLGDNQARIVDGPTRAYDVARFVGTYERAQSLLGWEPTVDIRLGLSRLVSAFQEATAPAFTS